MVFGARLRTAMSSIIRWRKGETLRAVGMESPMDFVLSMACHNSRKVFRAPALSKSDQPQLRPIRGKSGNRSPAKRVSTILHNGPRLQDLARYGPDAS